MRSPDLTLAKRVYDRLKQDIVSRRLQPGEPLIEEHLSETLRVSRTPIREALKNLNHDGLVRIVPNKGAFVRVVSCKDVREIFEVREALESYVASQAAGRLSEKELKTLIALTKQLKGRRKLLGHKDLRDAWENLRQTLLAATGNDRIKFILSRMKDQIEVARYYASSPPGRIEELLSDFIQVVRALCDRDPSKTAKALQKHLSKSKAVLLKLFGADNEIQG